MIYTSLAETSGKPSYALAWEQDLTLDWDTETWHQHFARSFKGIVNVSLVEASVRLLTCWYLVPSCLAQIFPGASPLCFRGCGHWGDLLHIWWHCPRLQGYWNRIFDLLRKVTGVAVPKSPLIALLNEKLENICEDSKTDLFYSIGGEDYHRTRLEATYGVLPGSEEEHILDIDPRKSYRYYPRQC